MVHTSARHLSHCLFFIFYRDLPPHPFTRHSSGEHPESCKSHAGNRYLSILSFSKHLPVDRSFRHERVQHRGHQRLPNLRQQPVALLGGIVQKPFGVRVRVHLDEPRRHVFVQVGSVHRVPLEMTNEHGNTSSSLRRCYRGRGNRIGYRDPIHLGVTGI